MNPQFFTEYKATSKVRIASSFGKKHIALIYGGMSAEREVSKSSAKGIEKPAAQSQGSSQHGHSHRGRT